MLFNLLTGARAFVNLLKQYEERKEDVLAVIELCRNNTDKEVEMNALTNFRNAYHTVSHLLRYNMSPLGGFFKNIHADVINGLLLLQVKRTSELDRLSNRVAQNEVDS